MKKTLISAFLATLVIMSFTARDARSAGPSPDRVSALLNSLRLDPGRSSSGTLGQPRFGYDKDGWIQYLGAPAGYAFPATSSQTTPEVVAQTFLDDNRDLFGVTTSAVKFSVKRTKNLENRRFVRFEQTYAGIPVFAAGILVQLDTANGIQAVFSDLLTDTARIDRNEISLSPSLTAEQIIDLVGERLEPKTAAMPVEVKALGLLLFAPPVLDLKGDIQLVWLVETQSEDVLEANRRLLVDAHDGSVARDYPRYYSLDRLIHDAGNMDQDGPLVRAEGQAPIGLADANQAYDAIGDTYSFYLENHGRVGIGVLPLFPPFCGYLTECATVRYCDPDDPCPWQNARWSEGSRRMYFGSGWAVDDVVAHEYTHGVTDAESDLIYENTPGAINESFSDIWGEYVDLTNGRGNDAAIVRWVIGEDLVRSLRDMEDPPFRGDPDRLSSPFYAPSVSNPDDTNDFGGVHRNSGVSNKLCFLLTDGDTLGFNGQTVYGMGIPVVADLFYEVNANLFTGTAPNWFNYYHALQQAAINLGWSDADQNNVYAACLAVEIVDVGRTVVVDGSSTCPAVIYNPVCILGAGPYTTVTAGSNAVRPGETLSIRAGNYDELVTFGKRNVIVRSEGGIVRIGPP